MHKKQQKKGVSTDMEKKISFQSQKLFTLILFGRSTNITQPSVWKFLNLLLGLSVGCYGDNMQKRIAF